MNIMLYTHILVKLRLKGFSMKKIIFACGFLSMIAACSPQTSGPIIVENPPSSELNR